MNIVFSTTRQWNPGDEFILLGCINLLKNVVNDLNPIIFNRNPQIRRDRKRDIIKSIDNLLGKDWAEKFLDNSVKDRLPFNYADCVVFAGSPEWRGRRLSKLYEFIYNNNLPTIFLGLGAGSKRSLPLNKETLSDLEIQVFKSAKLISCRDCSSEKYTSDNELKLKVYNLPCPALFSSINEKTITSVKKIALIYGTHMATKANNISEETHQYLIKLYNNILNQYSNCEINFIAHYIDELSYFKADFPNQKLFYSYDSKDYLEIYGKYDLVIGYRVHGIGISASMCIPGIMISHDSRSGTVDGFGASIINTNTNLNVATNLIDDVIKNIHTKNAKLKEHKEKYKKEYISLLSQALSK